MTWLRRMLLAALVCALTAAGLHPAPAAADAPQVPSRGTFEISGRGFGHGWGMSQYGAYGAATKGLTWAQIIGFYFPGTTVASQPAGTELNVWISADNDQDLTFLPQPGQQIIDDRGASFPVPAAAGSVQWRITRTGQKVTLSSRDGVGPWVSRSTPLATNGTWTVQAGSPSMVKVVLPGGAVREYRGRMRFAPYGSGSRTINRVLLEDYLRSVVPAEMPTSWHPQAVQAQAVVARTYAMRVKSRAAAGAVSDICDTIACQVYTGAASTVAGRRTVHETTAGNAAVTATAGRVVMHQGAVALTQFSSSNGGHSARGDAPYLVARADPYDGVTVDQSWRRTVSQAELSRLYPSVGAVGQIQITTRDGAGPWGGRVGDLRISGSRGSVTVTGAAFRSALGLRSTLFTIGGQAPWQSFPRHYGTDVAVDLVTVAPDGAIQRRPVTGPGRVGDPVTMSRVAAGELIAHAGDWNGDRRQDLIVQRADRRLVLQPGTSAGIQGRTIDLAASSANRSITSPGDWNGDGWPDLITLSTRGDLFLVLGNGAQGTLGIQRLGYNWGDRDFVFSPGDWNGDGRPDLISRKGDQLWYHPGETAGFGRPRLIGSGWRDVQVGSSGDITGDGLPDLLARRGDRITIHRGDGRGGLNGTTPIQGTYPGVRFPG